MKEKELIAFNDAWEACKKWEKNEKKRFKTLKLYSSLLYKTNLETDRIITLAKEILPNSKLAKNINPDYVASILDLYPLLMLMEAQLFEDKYPYKIKKTDIISELTYYDLESQNQIGEIGAGNGMMAFLLSKVGQNLSLQINEIEISNFLEVTLLFPDTTLNNNIEFIQGSSSQCAFTKKMDKIIIRNTFHHFENIEEMLISIHQSLKADGILFIKEFNKNSDNLSNICSELLDEQQILKHLEANSFHLIGKLKFENGYILKLKKISNQ